MGDRYVVATMGCDDGTAVVLDLTDDQAAAIRVAADAITARSKSDCEPTLTIVPEADANRDQLYLLEARDDDDPEYVRATDG